MSQSLYRKYRPETFADILGQDAVITTLKNAVEKQKIAHAYLFCGSRGTGKTTTARVFAKAINCENRKGGEPCNICATCVEIQGGGAIDVIEIDAASHGLIDNIRDLREVAVVLPSRLRYKVFIIDEAHGLSKSANNALLKMLEEPPAHVIFILATTEPEKLLPTIVSRTQRFDFWKIPTKTIAEKLALIAKREHLEISADAIRFISESASGSIRDAESTLDQIAASPEQSITLELVESLLGRPTASRLEPLIDAIVARDIPNVLKSLREIENKYSPFDLYAQLAANLRVILALSLAPNLKVTYAATHSPENLEFLAKCAEKINPRLFAPLIIELLRAESAIRLNALPALALEIYLVDALTDRS